MRDILQQGSGGVPWKPVVGRFFADVTRIVRDRASSTMGSAMSRVRIFHVRCQTIPVNCLANLRTRRGKAFHGTKDRVVLSVDAVRDVGVCDANDSRRTNNIEAEGACVSSIPGDDSLGDHHTCILVMLEVMSKDSVYVYHKFRVIVIT